MNFFKQTLVRNKQFFTVILKSEKNIEKDLKCWFKLKCIRLGYFKNFFCCKIYALKVLCSNSTLSIRLIIKRIKLWICKNIAIPSEHQVRKIRFQKKSANLLHIIQLIKLFVAKKHLQIFWNPTVNWRQFCKIYRKQLTLTLFLRASSP